MIKLSIVKNQINFSYSVKNITLKMKQNLDVKIRILIIFQGHFNHTSTGLFREFTINLANENVTCK